jgi:hypothetical protein
MWLLLGGVLGVAVTAAVVGVPDLIKLIGDRWRGEVRRAADDGWPPL